MSTRTYRQILVGMDFSPACRAALSVAARFASFDGGEVTVLHVMEPVLAAEIHRTHIGTEEDVIEEMRARVRSFLDALEIGTDHMKVAVEVGHPFAVLVNACHRFHADLLILGTRGMDHGPNHIGILAAKCVRKAPADVLLVREHVTQPFRQILACIDFSPNSLCAVQSACKIADRDRASLDCLYVFQSALALALEYSGYLPATIPAPSAETLEEWQKQLTEFLQGPLQETPGISCRSMVEERANIRDAIFEHVLTTRTDLVVLGTRGKTDLRALIMGSTAERIITHAPCSILAVKPDGFDFIMQ